MAGNIVEDEAFVSLVTNNGYANGALVLGYSLRRVNTTRKLVLLVTREVLEPTRERLARVWDHLEIVDLLDSEDTTNLALLTRPELGITFTKIHCWNLTQYRKCVFLDADTLIIQNCDELFERDELSAVPDIGWPDCFNSGVFVFEPSRATYEAILEYAIQNGSFDGGDQGLLNSFFSDWRTSDISRHLSFIYNMNSNASYTYAPAFQQFGRDVKIVHFIGPIKPWHHSYNPATGNVNVPSSSRGYVPHERTFLQLWWDIYATFVEPEMRPPPQLHPPPPQHYHPPPQHPEPPPQHYHPPPQHHEPPPQHYHPPPQHHEPPPQHYQPPPQHHEPPPQHYQPPPQHHEPPPQHHEPPPQHYQPPPQHHEPPPQNYQPPPQHYEPPPPPSPVVMQHGWQVETWQGSDHQEAVEYKHVVSEWHSLWHSSDHSSWHSSAYEDHGDSVLGESWSVENSTQSVETSPTQTASDPYVQQTVLLYSLEAVTFEQVDELASEISSIAIEEEVDPEVLDLRHRQAWESGEIDYLGRDKFDLIQDWIQDSISSVLRDPLDIPMFLVF
ncbi:unnamed protein product [Porites evermanni]|uniref:glycogenin glucosyltransferase n=1 Tax=Porites evermanni TaxID=104178 RepID=A0ABN8QEV2_9CNID|nr:unnamed protein product [Porites evermanni]